jgi:C4-type Zn-finger protein
MLLTLVISCVALYSGYRLMEVLARRARTMSNKRTCWIYCPSCHYDLNGPDSETHLAYDGENHIATYTCPRCHDRSRFDLNPPVPVRIPLSRVEIPIDPN